MQHRASRGEEKHQSEVEITAHDALLKEKKKKKKALRAVQVVLPLWHSTLMLFS